MAFCKYCGTQLPDDSVFCPNCGKKRNTPSTTPQLQNTVYVTQPIAQPIISQSTTPQMAVSQPTNFLKNRKVIIGIIAIVLLFIIFKSVSSGSGIGSNYETPIKYFCEAVNEGSVSKLYKALPPAFETYASTMFSAMGLDDTALLDELGAMSGGKSMSYTIISKEPLTSEELYEYSNDLSSSYMIPMQVESGYMLYVQFFYDGEETHEYIPVGKIDGRWCIIEPFF